MLMQDVPPGERSDAATLTGDRFSVTLLASHPAEVPDWKNQTAAKD